MKAVRPVEQMVTGDEVTDLRNVGTLEYKFECYWENWLKKREQKLYGEKE